ncbi:unnamed protein product [Rhizoctonia solani]|uniref:Jacalin-type lectin domain-containing protein n=1 Tax=Rhizoctonia solani TaxID=456999 RepID=A0A8H3ANW1_9AGAM|nr:unnamed protein product [Rhizoctonia solani]
MPDPTNELPNETQVLENLSRLMSMLRLVLTGVYFDASTGPVAASCPAVVINSSSTERIRPVSESVIEDIYPENELDAHHARLGWPSLSKLPERPWSILTPRDQRPLKTEIWASRRFMMQKWTMNISPRDLSPVEPLVEAVKDALGQRTNALRIRALREVFITWGEMIPVNVVVGACLVATGTLNNATTLPDSGTSSKSSSKENQGNLVDVVDRHLGTMRCFARRLETRVQVIVDLIARPRVTMTLEEGEYIIGVRGTHNDGWIFRLQFVTNKRTHPAFGTATGQVPFSFDAPKTPDGRDMVLHYMVGKYRGCLDSLLFVWAEMPLQMTSP